MTSDLRREREAAIYRAVLDLIGQGTNPSSMTVQQIASAAGIGKGTVYEYFASKDEIMRGVVVYCFVSEVDRIEAGLCKCTTLEQLQQAVTDHLIDLTANRMGIYHLLAGSMGGPPKQIPEEICRQIPRLNKIISQTMARLQQAGELDSEESPEYLGMALLSVSLGGYLSLLAHHCTGQTPQGMEEFVSKSIHRLMGTAKKV